MRRSGDWDVLVVGGGSAGCVLASRLTDDASRSVALVEAGPDYGPYRDGRWPADLLDARRIVDSHDWGYPGGSPSRRRGRVLGGSSVSNVCWVGWGSRSDYDEWAELGATGWSFDDLRPHLERAETQLGVRELGEHEVTPWGYVGIEACRELGYPVLERYNDLDHVEGVGVMPLNTVGTVRSNAAFAYLDPVRNRTNLSILSERHAKRLVIEQGRVVGVQVATSTGAEEVLLAGTVIVSCGAYGSPALLFRSGVGAADAVAASGVPSVVDLPGVGCNLVDHAAVFVGLRPTRALAGANARQQRSGAIQGPVVLKARSPVCAGDPWDLHVNFWAGGEDDSMGEATGETFVWMSIFAVKPSSRGVVLPGAIGDAFPRIDHRLLDDPRDGAVLVEGIRMARRLAQTAAVKEVVDAEAWPGSDVGDDELGEYVRSEADAYYHAVGTCRMGSNDDPMAVLDHRAAVRGLEGVFVVDASAMPTIPRAGTNLTTIAMAERFVELFTGGR